MLKLFLTLFLCLPLHAVIHRVCEVSYQIQNEDGFASWSEGVKTKVSFVSGQELLLATYDIATYHLQNNYALVWFTNKEVAILELNTRFVVTHPYTPEDFDNEFLFQGSIEAVQINSPERRRWKVTAKRMGLWLDPKQPF